LPWTSPKKTRAAARRSTRDGATCIETRVIDSTKVIKRLKETADRCIARCSVLGPWSLETQSDSKWKLTKRRSHNLHSDPSRIIQHYAQMVKPGGMIGLRDLFDCSRGKRSAGEKVYFSKWAQWSLETEQTFYPERSGPTEFYFARLKKS